MLSRRIAEIRHASERFSNAVRSKRLAEEIKAADGKLMFTPRSEMTN